MGRSEHYFGVEDCFTPSEAIVLGIAERTGTEPTELPPLYEVIDPEALDALARDENPCQMAFEYADYAVTVAGYQHITIHECETTSPTVIESVTTEPEDADQ